MTAMPPVLSKSAAPANKLVQTTCPYCGVGCGVDVLQRGGMTGTLSELKGSTEHPANFGRLCIKGTHLLETLDGNKRLLQPVVFGQPASWDDAIGVIAAKMAAIIEQHGPDAVAIYGSGQLLTEDYYVANKLMKGFIGTANIDTNSRLCMSSAVVAHKRAFGEDIVPCNYEDLEHTDLLILTGSNAAWTHPVLYQRIERAKLRNPDMKVVVVDPRKTDSTAIADLHIALKPGTDAVLFCGLLNFLANNNALDEAFIAASTHGFAETLAAAFEWPMARVAEVCDVAEAELVTLFNWFATLPRAITFFSMGINQSTSGVDKGNAIINCHLATGKIGKEGSGPFSITGQPNAMGGREVGGLSNMLAAHMDIDNPAHHATVKQFWNAPNLITKPGLRAVDMFQAAADGKVKCIWIMATNPVASMPNRALVEAALKQCELVIVSDTAAQTDTLNYAHIALPATGWSEKNGTVTNSERRISRQRGLVAPMGEAKHDWEILSLVGQALGFEDAFNYAHPAEIFAEHCALTAANNNGSRALDLGPLADLSVAQYDNLRPQQWPLNETHRIGTERLFADGSFYTPNRKANFVAITPRLATQQTSAEYPFVLNTGRIRDQWHTMTRTGNAPRLLKHIDRPWLSVHPLDAQALAVKDGDLLKAEAACSGEVEVILPVKIDDKQRRGEVFAPFHWSATWGSHAKVGALLNGANDALSGQPELKHGAIRLSPVAMQSYGLVYGDESLVVALQNAGYYYLNTPTTAAACIELADPRDPQSMVAAVLKHLPKDAQWATLQGPHQLSIVVTRNNKLVLAVLLADKPMDMPRDWLDSLYSGTELSPEQINGLLEQQPDEAFLLGKVVCSCFGVRENTIKHAIDEGNNTVSGLGKALKCGTNCGSCKTELASLIESSGAMPQSEAKEETSNDYAL
ncbi:nitrate reductase [Alteromonas lipolytica]|uniref:Nitrate reductase n=3 Tax=Alteromonas lipolytica TaxID=1856405 RepID=A0A1E8FKR4_9ALTE|nr:nitrate reductase [Alteromonas lipolytica]OFI36356.1 nitrate reductase [Alteromonas lipolytica]GGF70573.1 nitrate reductase [Alteromonas lipolytica]